MNLWILWNWCAYNWKLVCRLAFVINTVLTVILHKRSLKEKHHFGRIYFLTDCNGSWQLPEQPLTKISSLSFQYLANFSYWIYMHIWKSQGLSTKQYFCWHDAFTNVRLVLVRFHMVHNATGVTKPVASLWAWPHSPTRDHSDDRLNKPEEGYKIKTCH